MNRRRKTCRVLLTGHALQRFKERGGQGELTAGEVRRRLLGLLPAGAEVRNEAIQVPLGQGLVAVCVPELGGFWSVVTVERAEAGKLEAERERKEAV
jgi:hypothetical protein